MDFPEAYPIFGQVSVLGLVVYTLLPEKRFKGVTHDPSGHNEA